MRILAATDVSGLARRDPGAGGSRGTRPLTSSPVRVGLPPTSTCGRRDENLAKQVLSVPELAGVRCRAIVTAGDPADAIFETALTQGVDLIVMGAPCARRKPLFRASGRTVKRMIRSGSYAVPRGQEEREGPLRESVGPSRPVRRLG
jgi:nucleotide-binding universal stress UspA family protein